MKKERRNKIAGAAIALAMLGMMVGCGEKESSIDLMQGIKGEYIREEPEDEATDTNSSGAETPTFSGEASGNEIQTSGADAGEQKSLINADAGSVTDFGVRLLQQTLEEDKNTLVSPLSVISALGMTANGAAGDTLSQMEHTFGIALPELNEYLWAYREALPEKQDKYQLNMANAIWFRDEESFTVKEEFLQANADYYAATVKKAPFDDTTVKEINSWVSDNTNGMIDSILDKIPQEAVMCLVNALAFEAEWQETYYEHQVRDGEFTCEDGTAQNVKLMYS